jgi:hypothetical protein
VSRSQDWAADDIFANTILPAVRTDRYEMTKQGNDFAEFLKWAIPTGCFPARPSARLRQHDLPVRKKLLPNSFV